MRNVLFLTIIIFNCTILFGQKKDIYINDDLYNIGKSNFYKKSNNYKYYNLRFELDTLIVNVKVERIKKGKISKEQLNSIKKELIKDGNQILFENDIIIINYYPGKDKCNSGGNKSLVRKDYRLFLRRLKKLENVKQFFVYKTLNGTKAYGKKLHWISDSTKNIENTFFKIHYPCGSFVIIDENGNYYSTRGEYNIEKIIDLIKNRESTFANKV